ncbi:DUF802 domain-containing protein [Cupriavidus taiwanensis]|uniref:Putative transmembrane protein, DUF802 n=1 Tax=Cupriavidus taiwanensis TaxID=164546 RepID=A0A7Z7JCB6_9BURK|nr:DUF802 domain-containing protein [Cupriavidus taiwanensis]SOZ09678.1 putative transmembrane protein, DUF802 [Cupriavidus taiwanensis]SOZ11797.1 putative transmembrane protein, DUF802 [Cupriavidus taiwanensis]SOZ43152.1 putative transmembrane protein, DUF802 [Cupriavidus taiwanensis]SPC22398.1 putative transmembrane protein, DUF802 [Cupriavidus taiwanensis]SPD53905.1 conserved membrane protein of unknown function [Cupriavidus taiwanensis]
MTRYLSHIVAFLAGLAVVCWIGAGYAGTNFLALVVTLLIGGFYVAGALELLRYRQATATLAQALGGLAEAPASLGGWLERLHPSLRDSVRLRVEGERVGLPGPALTPYLVGLLVLLGMLGTFLGMVATLRGTGIALEGATDLQAIRASLAAPVKGLGFAFGTSVAGVATSAMLGLLSALCRRERIQAAQALDARIATTLRSYSRGHQRDEALRLLQRQADVMPALAEQMQAMMRAMAQQHEALAERLAASQDAFHGKTDAVYTRLAASVEQSLKESIADSARAAGAAIQPAVDATMAGLARETTALRDAVTQAVQQHLDGVSSRFESATAGVAATWNQALAGHQRTSEALAADLRTALDGFSQTFEQRSASLLDNVATRFDAVAASTAEAWREALSRQQQATEKLAGDNQQALSAAAATFGEHAAALVRTVDASHAGLQAQLAAQDAQRLSAWADTLGGMTATLRQQLEQLNAHTVSRHDEISATLARNVREVSAQTQAHASSTLAEIDRLVQAAAEAPKAAVALQAELASRDEARFAAWTDTLGSITATLRQEWQQLNAHTVARQDEISATLAQHVQEISAQTQAHASRTLAEIDRLVQAASEAPKAAVALQAELAERDAARFAGWTETLGGIAATLRQQWEQSSTHAAARQQEVCEALAQTARAISTETQAHTSTTLAEIDRLVQAAAEAPKAATALQAEMVAQDAQRLAAWTETLGTMAAALRGEWEQASAHATARQQEICETLSVTARDMAAQAQAQATGTVAEVSRLLQAASEAPRAAAEVIAELREKLTEGMARDHAMLEERSRMMETLGTLLDAVNHASTEQRTAVDTLVATTADLLERIGTRFTDKVESESGKLAGIAAQITGSAVEVASLGEAFGVAVQLFSESNGKLIDHLQRIEAALDKSMTRSDEQLAYYVAQAREVVDLSMLSQKQILEDLQLRASAQASGAEAA